jgi:hypothetical protein
MSLIVRFVLIGLLAMIPIVVAAAQAHFRRETDAAALGLFGRIPSDPAQVVSAAELQPLPPAVRRWLEGAGVVGKERARVVRLRQRGALRTAPEQGWMPAQARQYFAVDEPGFVWGVDVMMKRVLPVVGRDSYLGGHGRMLIKAGGLVTVADGSGKEIDKGTLLRYLGEIVWFPSAALAPYIQWEAVDDSSARATMTHGGISGSAIFTFDARGRMVRMIADRYMGSGPDAKLEKWEVTAQVWRPMSGVVIPVQGVVTWKLETGDFDYYRWEITDVDFNRRELYRR